MSDHEIDDQLMQRDYKAVTTLALANHCHAERIQEGVESILSALKDDDDATQKFRRIVERVDEMAKHGLQCMAMATTTIRRRYGEDRHLELRQEAIASAKAYEKSFAQEESDLSDDDNESLENGNGSNTSQRNKKGNKGRKTTKGGRSNKCSKPSEDEEESNTSGCDRSKLLLDGKQVFEQASRQLDSGHELAVVELSLIGIALVQLEEALDPQHFNYTRIQAISKCLLVITQILERYKMLIATVGMANAEEYSKSVNEHDDDAPLGRILLGIEKSIKMAEDAKKGKKGKNKLPPGLAEKLSELHAALRRFETGSDCPVNFDEAKDIDALKELVDAALGGATNPTKNLLSSSSHISMYIRVESSITMEKLYENQKEEFRTRANDLWEKVLPGVPYNNKLTMLEYRSKVLLPALARKELEREALVVADDMKSKLTDTRVAGQADIVLPVWQDSQQVTIAGRSLGRNSLAPADDYVSGRTKNVTQRRGRITSLCTNLFLQNQITPRLPDDIFPGGFVRTLLINAPSFSNTYCNFQKDKMSFFGSRFHGQGSKLVEHIQTGMSKYSIVETKIIVDRKALDAIKELLEL